MDKIKYVDTENGRLYTDRELYNSWLELCANGDTYMTESYKQYLGACLDKNGFLEEVTQITEEAIMHMVNDLLITHETANALYNLDCEMYAVNSPSSIGFYTTDGRYFYSYEDLETICEA